MDEKASAPSDSKWVREGVYKFSLELRNIDKAILCPAKEDQNHSFSCQTPDWGWVQFSRRDDLMHTVKAHDAFVIICTITNFPSTPLPLPTGPQQLVPKRLLDTVGSLLDDPTYSDVEFVFQRHGPRMKSARKIWACRQLLRRVEYFETMFSSGFAEGSTDGPTPFPGNQIQSNGTKESDSSLDFEDSDDEYDNTSDDSDSSSAVDSPQPSATQETLAIPDAEDLPYAVDYKLCTSCMIQKKKEDLPGDDNMEQQDHWNARARLSSPSSPQRNHFGLPSNEPDLVPGPRKRKVLVKDVAYITYHAVLYYIYTDTIVFAPLSSSFTSSHDTPVSTPTTTTPEVQDNDDIDERSTPNVDSASTRQEWITHWQVNNPGRPSPCSAKAAYRLADRLGIPELKERASQHILKSLTVENIAYEVFSTFSAAFDEIRKAQVDFFLAHWQDIRASDSMRHVWQQIRQGRHAGFEEVWPIIALSLEFKPPA